MSLAILTIIFNNGKLYAFDSNYHQVNEKGGYYELSASKPTTGLPDIHINMIADETRLDYNGDIIYTNNYNTIVAPDFMSELIFNNTGEKDYDQLGLSESYYHDVDTELDRIGDYLWGDNEKNYLISQQNFNLDDFRLYFAYDTACECILSISNVDEYSNLDRYPILFTTQDSQDMFEEQVSLYEDKEQYKMPYAPCVCESDVIEWANNFIDPYYRQYDEVRNSNRKTNIYFYTNCQKYKNSGNVKDIIEFDVESTTSHSKAYGYFDNSAVIAICTLGRKYNDDYDENDEDSDEYIYVLNVDYADDMYIPIDGEIPLNSSVELIYDCFDEEWIAV
jgi:hypothetical protein